MKRNRNKYIISVIFMFCILLGGMQHVSAQTLSVSGTWASTTVETQEVELSGDVTINGEITIPNGVTLTINGNSKMIQRAGGAEPYIGHLFNIQLGGKLVIMNATIDGNNEWEDGSVEFRPTSKGVRATGSFINLNKVGDITLTNVTLQNGWIVTQQELDGMTWNDTDNKTVSWRSSGTGINIGGGAAADTYTDKVNFTMTNCTIKNLYSTYNGPIFINRTSAGSIVNITDCQFKNNMVWYPENEVGTYKDGNQGGIIRTQGGTNADATISGGSFENNISNGQAGAIYWNAGLGSLTIKDNVQFKNNKAGTYGGAMMVMTKVDLQSATMTGNEAEYGGGLAYRPFNSGSSAKSYTEDGLWNGKPFEQLTNADMTLTDAVIISENTAAKGGGIFIESGNIRFATMSGFKDYDGDSNENEEEDTGESLFRDEAASMKLSINGATIYSNRAENGGGIYMESVVYKDKEGINFSPVDENTQSGLYFQSGTIQNNTATFNGGGVYLKGIPISFEGVGEKIVAYNKADGSGGGIYIDNTVKLLAQSLDVNLEKATISNNEAGSQGGGVYVTGSKDVVAVVNLEGITMTTNKATDNGGGLYLNGGDLNINGTGNTIQANNAQNGGGVCLEDGELVIEQCDITGNSAKNLGGGLFVSNNREVDISLTGSGIFENNNATIAGGGMAMQGPIKLTFSGSLQNNTAGNGGGIYLSNVENATRKTLLDFTGGYIKENEANGIGNTATTGHKGTVTSLKGFGGGAFLDSNTELIFTLEDDLGFYGNLAVSGADDIFANGDNTSVALPYVTEDETHDGMDLAGFDVPVDKRFLFWVKDYVANDTEYSQSPAGIDENDMKDGSNMRYRTSIEKGEVGYWKLEPATYTGYISLALGYRLLFATIQKSGLASGESAIFKIYKGTTNESGGVDYDDKPYSSILLKGKDDEIVSKRIAVSEGLWKVVETNWSWNYTPVDREIPLSVEENKENIFAFENKSKDDGPDKPEYDEAIKENRMNTSSSNTGESE